MSAQIPLTQVTVDVNVIIDGLSEVHPPQNLNALILAVPALANILSIDSLALVDSDHILDLVERKLVEVLNYSSDDACRVADLMTEISATTAGAYVDKETGASEGSRVQQLIPQVLLGDRRGQIDHEDIQVLGAAKFAANGEVGIVVTNDNGIHGAVDSAQQCGLHVLRPKAFTDTFCTAMSRMLR